MAKSTPHPKAFTIHEAIARLGLQSDGAAIAEQVEILEKGIAAEDEVSLLFCWLGRCVLVHKLDQLTAPPTANSKFIIPDLLVIFDYKGTSIPVLVEVKTCAKNSLSWRPDYIERLENYSKTVGIPLLVACKWKKAALHWTLTEACRFEKGPKNFKLSSERAIIYNLMFTLAGNFALVFREGITWHTKLRRLSPDEPIPGKKNQGRFTGKFEGDGFYTDVSGKKIEAIDERLWSFFMGQPGPLEGDGELIDLRFVNPKNFYKSADAVFKSLLSSGSEPPFWRELLRTYGIPGSAADILSSARARQDLIEKILVMAPREDPEFLNVAGAK